LNHKTAKQTERERVNIAAYHFLNLRSRDVHFTVTWTIFW